MWAPQASSSDKTVGMTFFTTGALCLGISGLTRRPDRGLLDIDIRCRHLEATRSTAARAVLSKCGTTAQGWGMDQGAPAPLATVRGTADGQSGTVDAVHVTAPDSVGVEAAVLDT